WMRACRWGWRSSETWSAGTSSNRAKGWASTRAPRPTCGAPSCGRRSTCKPRRSERLRSDAHGRDAPDVLGVLTNRPIARELAHVRHVQDRHARPGLRVAVCRRDALLARDVRSVVGQHEVAVTAPE